MTPPPPLALTRVSTVCFVLRHVRINSINGIVKLAHISDTFRDALESYSPTVWRNFGHEVVAHQEAAGDADYDETGELLGTSIFIRGDAFPWIARNLLTVGKFDVAVMWTHPLLLAAAAGAVVIVQLLLELLANDDCIGTIVDQYRCNALHKAVASNRAAVLKLLLEHSGQTLLVNARNKFDRSPLHVAAGVGHADCVRVLLDDAGCDAAFIADRGRTALHAAAAKQHLGVVRLLIEHDASEFEKVKNLRDNDGATALALTGTEEMRQLLRDHGCTL